MKLAKLALWAAMFLSGSMAMAQGTVDDYRRAYALREKYSADNVFYSDVMPRWIEDTHSLWYVRKTPEGRQYVYVDADKKDRKELFDHRHLGKELALVSGKEVKPEALFLERLSVNPAKDTLRFAFNNHRWTYAVSQKQLTDEGMLPVPPKQKHWMERDDEKEGAPVTSPDGKYVAFIKNDNVCVRNVATGRF